MTRRLKMSRSLLPPPLLLVPEQEPEPEPTPEPVLSSVAAHRANQSRRLTTELNQCRRWLQLQLCTSPLLSWVELPVAVLSRR